MILAVTGASTHQGWGYTAVKLCAYTFFGPLALKKKKRKKKATMKEYEKWGTRSVSYAGGNYVP